MFHACTAALASVSVHLYRAPSIHKEKVLLRTGQVNISLGVRQLLYLNADLDRLTYGQLITK